MFLKLITSSLLMLISRLIDDDVITEIKALILAYMNVDDINSDDKRLLVQQKIKNLKGELGENVAEMSSWLINLAIEVIYGYFKIRKV